MDNFAKHMDPSSLSNTKLVRQKKMSEAVWKKKLHQLKRYIAKWVYVHGIPFNAINNEEFDLMLEAASLFGTGARKPNQHELREKLVYEEVEETKKMLKVEEKDYVDDGYSIMTDAWTYQKRRSVMNLCLHCSIGSNFLESKEVSYESHTGKFIYEYVDGCVERIGAKNVVQVVTNNAANNMAAKKLLYLKRPNIFWSSCATHTLNLMLEGIGENIKKLKTTIDQANSSTIFIYSHHKSLSLCRGLKKRDIVRPDVTKFVAKAGCKDYDFNPAKWWGNYGTQVSTLQKMAIRILYLTSSSSGYERNRSCFEGIHTKKRNKLNSDRLNNIVFVQYNNKMNGRKEKAKKNKKMDPLVNAEATHAQGWLVEGGDDDLEAEPVVGLTWKLIEETCDAEVTKLHRSARLSQAREIDEEDVLPEAEEPIIEDGEIDYESDQDDVVPIINYEDEGENND